MHNVAQRQPQPQPAYGWRRVLAMTALYAVAVLFVAQVLQSYTTPHTTPATAATRDRPTVAVSAPVGLHRVSLASRGDALDVYVDVVTHRGTPVAFVNLTLDEDALSRASPVAQLAFDLTACLPPPLLTPSSDGATAPRRVTDEAKASRVHDGCNSSSSADVVARIVWVVRGVSFTTYTTLTRTLPDSDRTSNASSNGDDSGGTSSMRTYLQPTLTLSPVMDFASPPSPAHAALVRDVPGAPALYGPAVYVNNFWRLRKHLRPLPQACEPTGWCNVSVHVTPTRAWKVALYEQLDASARQQVAMGLASESVGDEFKSVLLDTSPYLLAVTAIVTVLHMLFEFLAMSNDVQFWRGRRDLSGLSLRSIVINCYFQSVIFLYLLDRSEQTSWAILAPAAAAVCMEYWKLAQTLTLQRDERASGDAATRAWPWRGRSYRLAFKATYNTRTRKHDADAVRYLVYLMLPVLAGYSVYSALYTTHASWYSYLITTQVQFIYFFGFAMMTPQIFINYKLKSVGQLPWRTFVYKALNTVIDDLFAFVIHMPWLHRLACFRDDVVFVILLYQRCIYPVDTTRRDGDDVPDDDNSDNSDKKQQ